VFHSQLTVSVVINNPWFGSTIYPNSVVFFDTPCYSVRTDAIFSAKMPHHQCFHNCINCGKVAVIFAITKMPFFFDHQDLPKFTDAQRYVGLEDNFQQRVAFYLDLQRDCLYFHTPNGGKRYGREGAKLQRMGVKSGVPDILILTQRKGYAGLAIELKVGRNTPTDTQKDFLRRLHELNYLTFVSWSLDEVVALIDWYFEKSKK
jgi:hypothetical protein